MNTERETNKRLAAALEMLFLALAALYLVYEVSRSTTIQLRWPGRFESYMMCAMAVTAAARLLTCGLIRLKTLAALALAVVYGLVYRRDGYSFLIFLAIFTVGFIDIDYRKILKVYLVAVGAFYGVTMLAGILGVVTNFVTARAGRGIRSAWGMSYYTDFASLGLFLLMNLWVACGKLPDWAMLPFCGAYLFLSACVAHSNTSTICAGLFIFAVLCHGFSTRLHDRGRRLRWIRKGPELFAALGFPLMALAMFFLMLLYARGMNIGYRLNNLLSNRLMRGVAAWRKYGLTAFGTPFAQNGNGFSTFPSNVYNFVDSTYPLVLLRYGWVTLLALCLSWGLTARQARRCGDRRLLLVMGIIAVHAFSEHHFIESHFNILVAMPLAAYPAVRQEASFERKSSAGRTALAWTATALLFAATAWRFGPTVLCRLKTALELMHYGHGEHALRLVCVLGAALFGLCLAAWAVSSVAKALLGRSGLRACRTAVAALLLCVLMGSGAWLYTGRVIDGAAGEYTGEIDTDRQALEIAIRAATGRVSSGVLPALYGRAIEGMAFAAYFEDDMSRLRGDTVLMPSDAERGPFIDNGFLYVPISDAHALYTGDRAVVEALSGAGYSVTGYYSSEQTVDLAVAAELNGLAYNSERGVVLSGDDVALSQGPWQDLYGGKYTVTWELALPEGVAQPKGKLCTLGVTTFKGDKTVVEKGVKANRFDDEGRLRYSMKFQINDSRDVAFQARTEPGAAVEIRKVSFVRTPEYDVHTFYDDRLRKTRDEYYGTDGEPILRKEGWFACDYSYDRHGNVTCVRYYDCDGAPTLIADGYAERRRVFDGRDRVVREAFYGADGQPIVTGQGYAASEREYDGQGNAVVIRYFGVDGAPILAESGYATIEREFNGLRQVVGERYFGVDGNPVALARGQYGEVIGYDAAGNVTMRRYLDARGLPTLVDGGYAEFRRVYNKGKKIVRMDYYGADGAPIVTDEGYAAYACDYDEAGNTTAKRYFGANGEPVKSPKGYAEIRYAYNDKDQKIREAYFGVDGKPINLRKKYASVEFEYDANGKLAAKRYYNKDGKLVKERSFK